jgi:hypothetical protein
MLGTYVPNHNIDINVSDNFFLESKRQAPRCGKEMLEIVLPHSANNADKLLSQHADGQCDKFIGFINAGHDAQT